MKRIMKSLLIGGLILTSISITILHPQFHKESFNKLGDIRFKSNTSQNQTFIVGRLKGPTDLDPVHCMDSNSEDVIYQVAEGLFMHNLSDPELKFVPRLASDYGNWDTNGMHYTVPLRQGVIFHDSTKFNASSVRWNFERINWFLNATGDLNTTIARCHPLWRLPNGSLILDAYNPITINNEYNITINLVAPYTILESLLCHVNSYILSPTSTPEYKAINTTSGDLVGTGPFVYDYYVAHTEVRFHRWDNYWKESAFLDQVIFEIIIDSSKRNNAFLNGSIHFLIGYLPSLLPTFRSDPNIVVEENRMSSFSYYHLCMNNKKINKTWRQAISYAIDYNFIIEVLLDHDNVLRSNGPLAPSFPGYNGSIRAATLDLAKARQILIDANIPGTEGLIANNDTTGSVATAWKTADLASWNYSQPLNSGFRVDLEILLLYNLDLIGIDVIDQTMHWADFIYRAYGYLGCEGLDSLEFFWIGWGPDYLEPFNMISALFSNNSKHLRASECNSVQYHNHQVEMWLEDVLKETDPEDRDKLYSKILHQIVEVDMPHVFGYHSEIVSVYHKTVKGFHQNALNQLYCYTISFQTDQGEPNTLDIPGYSIFYISAVSLIMITYLYKKKRPLRSA